MVLAIRSSPLRKFSLVLDPTSLRIEYHRRRNKIPGKFPTRPDEKGFCGSIGDSPIKKSYNDMPGFIVKWIKWCVFWYIVFFIVFFIFLTIFLSTPTPHEPI